MNGTGDGSDNKSEIKVIIRTLAGLAIICVLAECVLSYLGKQIPPELNTLTGGLVGSLTAMLVKTSPTQTSTASADPPKQTGEIKVPEQTLETKST
jgi:hypothetical protein